MSRRLVTQLTEEKPRVLLVGRETLVRQKIGEFLQRQSLQVDFATSSISNSDIYYKIILIGDGLENEKTLDLVKDRQNLIQITLISSLDEKEFNSLLEDQIVGVDVIENDYFLPKITALFSKLEAGFLIDPRTDFYLQSLDGFLQVVKQKILVPNREKIIVFGQKHSSLAILNEFNRLFGLFYQVPSFEIKDDFKAYPPIDFSGYVFERPQMEALPSLLEPLARAVYQKKNDHVFNAESEPKKNVYAQNLNQPSIVLPVVQPKSRPAVVTAQSLGGEKTEVLLKQLAEQVGEKKEKKVDEPVKTIDDKLSQLFKDRRVEDKVERVQDFVIETKKIKKISKKRKVLFTLGMLMTFSAAGLLVAASVFWFSIRSVETHLSQVFEQISANQNQPDYTNLVRSSGFLQKQANFYNQFLPPEILSNAENVLEISKKIEEYNKLSTQHKEMLLNSVSVVLGKDLLKDSLDVQKQAKLSQSLNEVASKLLSRLNDLSKSKVETKDIGQLESFISQIEDKKNSLLIYQQLAPILDDLLGQNKKKTYAIVFQNNQELRPTGGFLQAVAIVTVDQGMIVDSQVYSSYELDQKLGGAVVPPDEVLKLLGENKWYLRDSNWDPDFIKSGKQISWFLEQQLNKQIDGVIGVNLFVLQNFLKEIGPLDLAEFNEVITDKNLFERSEFHSEIKLVDASSVEDYQAKLLKYLIRDLLAKGQENPQKIVTALKKSLQEKQMTLFFENNDLYQAFTGLGWTGELVIPQCPAQLSALPCHVDALAVNEANIGINKANYHTTRQDSHEIEIVNNQINHHRTITLNNEAFSNAWPKGEYRSYFRFYLPEHSQAIGLVVDGNKVKESEVLIAKQGNRLVLGLLVSIPIKSTKKIELNYSLPLEYSAPYSYVFFSQKQPGTNDVLKSVVLRHENDLSPTLIAPKAEVSGDTIHFNDLAEDHAFVGVSFK